MKKGREIALIALAVTSTLALAWISFGMAQERKKALPPLSALGPVPIPADNPMSDSKVELGKILFFDPRLSGDASTSCASCHAPKLGWTDGQDLCRGYPGTVHWRNCQSVINSAYYQKLFWAGSSLSLESQAEGAAKGAVAGNGARDMMEERLRQIPEYAKRFRTVFGTERPQLKDAWKAIAAFERTLVQPDTPFDRYLKGESTALSEKAKRGLRLFQGKARCILCHNGPLLTDEKYYNLGVPGNPAFEEDHLRQITFRFEQYAKGVPEEIYRIVKTDLGLYYRMKRKEDMGKFRTPTLRYLAYTAPYMHNGVFFTLEEVIDFYDQGGGEDPIQKQFGFGTKTKRMKPLHLTKEEKETLGEFLKTLSGKEIIVETPDLPDYSTWNHQRK